MSPRPDRELLLSVARTSLRTKLPACLADRLSDDLVEAISCLYKEGQPLDLFMVEVLHMKHRLVDQTKLIKVGDRNLPAMPLPLLVAVLFSMHTKRCLL